MGHCCHSHKSFDEMKQMAVDFDEEPIKKDDGTYEVALGSITSVGDRSVEGWKDLMRMHACSLALIGCLGGLCAGLLAGHVISLFRK